MPARMGKAPWSEGYTRATAATRRAQGVEWSLSSGYRQPDEWNKEPRAAKTKRIKLANGRTAIVPDNDYEDFLAFKATDPKLAPLSPDTALGQYLDEAFSNPDKIDEVDGVGHIRLIEYVLRHQVMRVEFVNYDDIVVFFRVPKEVYGELYHLAKSGAMALGVDGKPRHALGIKFWDIVRIRGQREGARYKFEYAYQGQRTGPRETAADVAQQQTEIAVQDVIGKADNAEKEMIEWIDTFRRALTDARKEEYDRLTSFNAKFRFIKQYGRINGKPIDIDLEDFEDE